MNNKPILGLIFLAFLFLAACRNYKASDLEQCLGVWKMLDDKSNVRSIVLKSNGEVKFNNLLLEDIGGHEGGKIPSSGIWKLVSDGSILEIWFTRNGGDYGQGGKLMKKKEGLEVWFAVGDPDDLVWKRFRLVDPTKNADF